MCDSCSSGDGKYCCPGCSRRTCSLTCVREHKIKYMCSGLKGIATSPVAVDPTVKYTEDLFLKDYSFLESVCSYKSSLAIKTDTLKESQNKEIDVEKEKEETDSVSEPRQRIFKRIQKIGKLAELVLLPPSFSRSKQNKTRLISNKIKREGEDLLACPEEQSTRRARISWTVDLVDFQTDSTLETLNDISDDTLISEILSKTTSNRSPKRIYLRNETRTKGIAKWREIEQKNWSRSISFVLIGARCFEYPRFGIEAEEDGNVIEG